MKTHAPVFLGSIPFARRVARLCALALAAATLTVLPPAEPALAQGGGPTTVSVSQTATGYNERRIVYDWVLGDPFFSWATSSTIGVGECGNPDFYESTARLVASDTTGTGVRGQVCVQNTGNSPTAGLTISVRVQFRNGSDPFQDLPLAAVTITPAAQVPAGETACFPYSIPFAAVADAEYRTVANATISNPVNGTGPTFEAAAVPFTIPDAITTVEEDETATLVFSWNSLPGHTITTMMMPTDNTWHITDVHGFFGAWLFVCNDSVECPGSPTLTGTWTLTEDDTGQVHTASSTVTITTPDGGDCDTEPGTGGETGCTYTQGYYKRHPEALPLSMMLGNVSYTREEQRAILRTPVRGNGLIALEHQLIAAQANIANGASAPQEVLDAIAEANALIAGAQAANPSNPYLSPNQTSGLVEILASYNEGTIGPGHCE